MKKYFVNAVVCGDYSDSYYFNTLAEAKAFFDKKAKALRYDRIKENEQATIKFRKGDTWGYELWSVDYENIDSASYTWED